MWCWGDNGFGQLGDGTTTNRPVPVQVSGHTPDWATVSDGLGHTCAEKTEGTVWCWGWNIDGQLGDGTTTDSPVPVQVSGM
jgi:alpha-tubulin suppressor-like RCC1 family protein